MTMDPHARMPRLVSGVDGANVHLTMAMSEYEHARDLTSGLIRPRGITLTSLMLPIEEMAFRYFKNFEFDVCETSFAKFITLTGSGNSPIVGIPVFPARLFRCSAIYVRKDSGITGPQDFEGRAVGIPEWAQTAGVYVRGMLAEYYGVALEKVNWFQASVNEPGRVEKVSFHLPPQFHYVPRPDKCISDMLASGEIDAAITARPPRSFIQGNPDIVRLFPDFRGEEIAYHQATGIFPIMHVMSMRRAVFEAYPWVASNLLTAFEQAKDAAVERMLEITTSRLPLPWGAAYAAEMAEKMGGDLWPYGVDANRHTLNAFCRFAYAQHLTASPLTPEDLFPREVIAYSRV
jgi:4,5-dihydroxyphthalate decarboxylase